MEEDRVEPAFPRRNCMSQGVPSSLALGGNGSLMVASSRTVFHGREKPRPVAFSLSSMSDDLSCFPFRHGLLPSQHWKGCLQSVCQGSPWRKTRKGRSSRQSADGSRAIRASLHGRMKLCVPGRERWAPCRPLRRDQGWHEQCTCRGAGSCSQGKADTPLQSGGQQQRCFGALGSIGASSYSLLWCHVSVPPFAPPSRPLSQPSSGGTLGCRTWLKSISPAI